MGGIWGICQMGRLERLHGLVSASKVRGKALQSRVQVGGGICEEERT